MMPEWVEPIIEAIDRNTEAILWGRIRKTMGENDALPAQGAQPYDCGKV